MGQSSLKSGSEELEDLAFELRSKLLHLCGEGAVHIGGDLSSADILTALYEYGLNVDPSDISNLAPRWGSGQRPDAFTETRWITMRREPGAYLL